MRQYALLFFFVKVQKCKPVYLYHALLALQAAFCGCFSSPRAIFSPAALVGDTERRLSEYAMEEGRGTPLPHLSLLSISV